jgi:hypothetical protein
MCCTSKQVQMCTTGMMLSRLNNVSVCGSSPQEKIRELHLWLTSGSVEILGSGLSVPNWNFFHTTNQFQSRLSTFRYYSINCRLTWTINSEYLHNYFHLPALFCPTTWPTLQLPPVLRCSLQMLLRRSSTWRSRKSQTRKSTKLPSRRLRRSMLTLWSSS